MRSRTLRAFLAVCLSTLAMAAVVGCSSSTSSGTPNNGAPNNGGGMMNGTGSGGASNGSSSTPGGMPGY